MFDTRVIHRNLAANFSAMAKALKKQTAVYGHVSRSSGLAKTILQGTVKGGRRQGGQRKRWADNIREWTGLSSASPRGQWRTGKNEENGCKIICGAPTTLAVKGLMMMMMTCETQLALHPGRVSFDTSIEIHR